MATYYNPHPDYIYLNGDGTWTSVFKAWDDAILFYDYGSCLIPASYLL